MIEPEINIDTLQMLVKMQDELEHQEIPPTIDDRLRMAYLIWRKNLFTVERMTELATVKDELYKLKAALQLAASDFQTKAIGQTPENGIIKL